MNERTELQVHDFLVEGRDEAKSHVILETASPAPEEADSHGYFFALAELSGATPKTIQMVRAWIEFAIQAYYSTTPSNIEAHFETILQQLNTQSSLYLKQHANETVHMTVAVACKESLYLALHGNPAALLLYRKNETWQCMELRSDTPEQVGNLFSNVMNGTLRPGDRLFLATPHIVEFFSSDRLAKISDNKTMDEVSEHMEHVLTELSSDFSFAGVWMQAVPVVVPEEVPAAPSMTLPKQIPEKKTKKSMEELMRRTRTTEELLSPPVISIPKDKIVTNLLKLSHRGLTEGGKLCVSATKTTVSFVRTRGTDLLKNKISPGSTLSTISEGVHRTYSGLPQRRRTGMFVAVGALVLAIGGVGAIAYAHSRSAANAANAQTLSQIEQKIASAEDAFLYQNEPSARALITDAETSFASLPASFKKTDEAQQAATLIDQKKQKIFHVIAVAPAPISEFASVNNIIDLASGGPVTAALTKDGTLAILRDAKFTTLSGFDNASHVAYDDDTKGIILQFPNRVFKEVTPAGTATPLTIAWMSEDTQLDAFVFYAGRLYTYNAATKMVYRYDKTSPDSYGNGKRWIADSGRPTGVTQLAADSSLWMRTSSGNILKFTAGKLQPFSFSGVIPDISKTDHVATGNSAAQLYFLDREHTRVIVTDRDGKLTKQLVLPSGTNLTRILIDKNETAVIGITDDGRLVKISLK